MVKFKNRDGVPFQFVAMASAIPLDPMPTCKTCCGSGKKYGGGFGGGMCYPDEDNEPCSSCNGRGREYFHGPLVEFSIQVKLQEYLEKLLIERDDFRKQFLAIGENI